MSKSRLAEIFGVEDNEVFKFREGLYYVAPYNRIHHIGEEGEKSVDGFTYAKMLSSPEEIKLAEPTPQDIEIAKAIKLLFPKAKSIRRGTSGKLYVRFINKSGSTEFISLDECNGFLFLLKEDGICVDDVLRMEAKE